LHLLSVDRRQASEPLDAKCVPSLISQETVPASADDYFRVSSLTLSNTRQETVFSQSSGTIPSITSWQVMTRSLILQLCAWFSATLVFTALGLKTAAAQAFAAGQTSVRITQLIDESSLIRLSGNTHALAQPRYDAGPAPVSMPASRLLLVLRRSSQQEADLETYLESVQNPNSPNYRQWITPEEFGRRYGISDNDLVTVETWLRGNGFTINKVAKGRMAIEISGTVGQVQSAFHTSLHR